MTGTDKDFNHQRFQQMRNNKMNLWPNFLQHNATASVNKIILTQLPNAGYDEFFSIQNTTHIV